MRDNPFPGRDSGGVSRRNRSVYNSHLRGAHRKGCDGSLLCIIRCFERGLIFSSIVIELSELVFIPFLIKTYYIYLYICISASLHNSLHTLIF